MSPRDKASSASPARHLRFLDHAPLPLKVTVALSLTLLPLGVIALSQSLSAYSHVRAAGNGPLQVLGIAAPLLMWIVAVAVAWSGVNRLVIEPLRRMRAVVERYSTGDASARMADGAFGSPELAELAAAFDSMADRMAGHATQLEAALATQRALTREVHHRVKNNLQIVSSLLSLQARDATSAEAIAAYALIRQRVNALALVHRWMYQDEGASGVELRPLLADLSANLEHGFDGRAQRARRVTCSAGRIAVGQDTALPIAFLITELVASSRDADDGLTSDARIEATHSDGLARLTIASPAFSGDDGMDRFEDSTRRIVAGLARQLRNPLRYDGEAHRFSIEFPALGG